MKKHLIVLIAVGIIIAGAAAYYLLHRNAPATVTSSVPAPTAEVPEGAIVITLTEDGFVPDEVTISAGDTIAFVTTAGKLFWPASNLHPSHALYPEFDPKMPIQSDEVWSFTFTRPGAWKFHDHLSPYFTGVITVE